MKLPLKSALGLATVGLAAGLLSGCSYLSPVQTSTNYQSSDGSDSNLAQGVDLRNVLVVATDSGDSAALVGSLVNTSNEEHSVEFSAEKDGKAVLHDTVTVPANSTIRFSPANGGTLLSSDPGETVLPGTVLDGKATDSSGGTEKSFPVPVLGGDFAPYKQLVKAIEIRTMPAIPEATPSAVPAPTTSPTPSPSPSASPSSK